MSEPPITYRIWAQHQPAATVKVRDLAELVTLLEGMHRAGILIEAVVNVTDPCMGRRCSPQPNGERSAE